jgi:hypothetical protein
MTPATTIRVGGFALIGGAAAFLAVFGYLAAVLDYPAVLDGSAATVLPALLATGLGGRAAWALYALLPILWIPAGAGAFHALRRSHPGAMLVAVQAATVAAIAMMLGLMRWPSIHWHLATLYVQANAEQQQVVAALFEGLNTYLGNFIGEFMGECAVYSFFALASWALLRGGHAPRWVGIVGLVTAASGTVGAFRNATPALAPVAEVNNYLLPAWMILLGVVLLRIANRFAAAPVDERT